MAKSIIFHLDIFSKTCRKKPLTADAVLNPLGARYSNFIDKYKLRQSTRSRVEATSICFTSHTFARRHSEHTVSVIH